MESEPVRDVTCVESCAHVVSAQASSFWAGFDAELIVRIFALCVSVAFISFQISRITKQQKRQINEKIADTINSFAERLYSDPKLSEFFKRMTSGGYREHDIDLVNVNNKSSKYKNEEIIYSISYLNSACIYVDNGVIAPKSLSGTTIGFLISICSKDEVLNQFIEKINASDGEKYDLPGAQAFLFYQRQKSTIRAAYVSG